ncbi:M36 family metallopeptidase [Bacillus thuringiensis]|uniref:M36 family metallopeptidase n=1 Tax=Bacillus thuringiensis TaxID=1428 RepID=UPI000C9EA7B5|nr:M36 family metallopeptidase [Bacillus thuringiensis]
MSQSLDAQARENGTKFLVYPQNKKLKGFEQPEIIFINKPPGSIQAGPQDEKMYVVDAKDKSPYQFEGEGPPYQGPQFPAVQPNTEGHFDHISPNDPAFSSTVMYATVRRVLDIWTDYFGHEIEWFFSKQFPKLKLLELIPRVKWDNAQSGTGFLEFGFGRNEDGSIDKSNPYCENFDVLAHEIGHTIKNSTIGSPENRDLETREYGGHHESFGDLVAIVSVMHFDSVINRILNTTKGNLFSINELSRMGELSQSREIRIAFNDRKMSDVQGTHEVHILSEPFTGGAFDVLVEVFQIHLINKGIITKNLGERAYKTHDIKTPDNEKTDIQQEFEQCYQGKEAEFKQALLDARDYFGKLMAKAWSKTSCDNLSYGKVLNQIIEADRELNDGKYKQTIIDCFDWRGISPEEDDSPIRLKTHIVDEFMNLSNIDKDGNDN